MISPKISVVIPSFNQGKYIDRTLRSIFSQEYENYEVMIQDGGSTDKSIAIIKKYAKKYKNLAWTSKKDGGQLDAINSGLKKATGDIVTFINTDDTYEKGTFSTVAAYFTENPKALWFAGKCYMIDENDKKIAYFWTMIKNMLLKINSYFLLLFTSNYLSQPAVFINNKAYKKYGPFMGNKKFVYEYDLWLKLGKISMPVVINRYLSSFRITTNNKSSLMYNDLFEFDLKVVKNNTNNPVFIIAHKINNLTRVMVRKLM